MDRWTNKVAVVTGASSGIGKAIAIKLVKYGMKVVGCARNDAKLEEIAAAVNKEGPGKMYPHRCDLTDEAQILSMFKFIEEKLGELHLCVNNAGLGKDLSLITGATEGWKRMFDVNVMALCICTREAIKLMKASNVDNGHVININSLFGHIVGDGLYSICGSKFAVTALTEGLRQELRAAKSHIRSTSISPGFVETDFAYRLFEDNPDQAKQMYSSMKCLEADDIADAVIYALSAPAHVNVSEVILRPIEQRS